MLEREHILQNMYSAFVPQKRRKKQPMYISRSGNTRKNTFSSTWTKILVCMYVNHEIPRILTKLSFMPYLCVKVGFPDVDPEMERSQKGFWVDKTFLPFAPCPQSERLLWPLLTLSPTFYQLLLFYPALTLI